MANQDRQQPNKVLSIRAVASEALEAWPYEDFPGDPYWQGGSHPKPYRWIVDLSVTAQLHGDPSTRAPYRYTGMDIFIGDWVTDLRRGKALRVTNILQKESGGARVVLEDIDRYNTFTDEDASGLFAIPGNGVVFSVSDAHTPILSPLPPTVTDTSFVHEINGRFGTNNPLYRKRIVQESHNLNDNEAIWVDPTDGLFKGVKDDTELKRMVGTVDRTGPGADVFYFIPTTKVVDGIDPPLPGNAGDLIYVNSFDGTLSTLPSETVKVAYIQLTNTVPDITRSSRNRVIPNSVLGINNANVTFTGSTLQSVVNDVNNSTYQHRVTAKVSSGINTTVTNPSSLVYGKCAAVGSSAIIDINGHTVNFTSTTNGTREFGFVSANAVDMAYDINNANIPDINAIGITSLQLVIRHMSGQAITITNINTDTNGTPFAGTNSCSGIDLHKDADGADAIMFVNESGNGIMFKNISGTPVSDLGLTSVRNGEVPLGLVVEQYVVESDAGGGGGANVYATLSDLPTIGTLGSQAFVIDSEDRNGNKSNEWTMLIWDGFSWVKTSDEDSARTDARSMESIVTFESASVVEIGTLSDKRRVAQVVVEVIDPFNGPATLDIGDPSDSSRLMQDNLIDLSIPGNYSTSSNFIYQTGNDITISAYYDNIGATSGSAKVIVTYI